MMAFRAIAHDHTDEEGLARRMAVRERHLAAATRLISGAILDEEGRMVGSMTAISFPDQAAFDEWLRNVPYTRNGVWESAAVHPYHVATPAQLAEWFRMRLVVTPVAAVENRMDAAIDAEDITTQAEEANALDPVG